MHFKRLIFLVLFVNLAERTLAQAGLEDWNPGYLITIDEDSLFGPVSMLFGNDLVQINDENKIKTFGANQVQMIYIRERDNSESERYIYPFPYHPYSDFKPQRFFEMLFSGIHLSLLSRETLVTETIPQYDNFSFRTFYSTRTRLLQEYYLLFPEKKVRRLAGSKKEFLNLLADRKDSLKKFIAEGKLDMDRQEDLLKIVKEYNRLKSEK
jgi:hypothetical protein